MMSLSHSDALDWSRLICLRSVCAPLALRWSDVVDLDLRDIPGFPADLGLRLGMLYGGGTEDKEGGLMRFRAYPLWI